MNKKEFLDILYEQLSGQMLEGNVAAHVQYYRNYIEEEQRKGRSEDDILNELGDPHLIARTLLDTEAAASGNPRRCPRRHAQKRRRAGHHPHSRRHRRRTPVLYGSALPEPLHRRRACTRQKRICRSGRDGDHRRDRQVHRRAR